MTARKRILITGATGFVGTHLTEALQQQPDADVHGLGREPNWPASRKPTLGHVPVHTCDLCDRALVEAILREIEPEQIYHLAGYAHAGKSAQEPDAAWKGNLTATRTLYESIRRWGGHPRILFVGSGLIYGEPKSSQENLDELAELRPTSPYATSKAAADLLSYECCRTMGLNIVRVRPFNHIGPGQSPDYATASFARQIALIEKRLQSPVLETGNLASCRDLTDVRDMVGAYILLMQGGQTGEAYNAGSGEVHSMQSLVDRLIGLAGVKVEVRQKGQLVRPTEINTIRANSAKLRACTGWRPMIELEQTLADTLAYWREQT